MSFLSWLLLPTPSFKTKKCKAGARSYAGYRTALEGYVGEEVQVVVSSSRQQEEEVVLVGEGWSCEVVVARVFARGRNTAFTSLDNSTRDAKNSLKHLGFFARTVHAFLCAGTPRLDADWLLLYKVQQTHKDAELLVNIAP